VNYFRIISLLLLTSLLAYLGIRHYFKVEFTDVLAVVAALFYIIFGAVYEAIH